MLQLEEMARRDSRRIVGLMTGTSADGIDAVLAEIGGSGESTHFEVLAHTTVAIGPELEADLFQLFLPDALVDDLCRVNVQLGHALAQASLAVIEAAGLEPKDVDLIGSHGQTIRHFPQGEPTSTLQIGEPSVIAQLTGITTVADFRPADMAVGGEGAPLVPLVDYLLFAHATHGRLMLNIGGIANVTVLPADAELADVTAFDLGPGNMLMDGAVAYLTGGAERFDRDGRRAAAGSPDIDWVARLLKHEFIQRQPPKSTGREEFGIEFLGGLMNEMQLSPDDRVATLTAFTAASIGYGIQTFAQEHQEEVWVSGGGVHNAHLMELLGKALPQSQVRPIDGLGVPADAKEALCFAILANETIVGNPGNVLGATGASQPAILGKIAPGGRLTPRH
jgi:anhydro-N-acetylmuramic acid kinase